MLAPSDSSGGSHSWNCNMMMINTQKNPDYKAENDEGAKKVGKNLQATSCYRSAAEQRAACEKICQNGDGCPGLCAPPGRSNHQKVAAADIGGIPGSVEAGCKYLFDRCQTLRAENPSMGCEIGGYGAGAHHFAFGKIKNSAYNKCKFLKSQMGQDPSAWKKKQKEADDLYNQVMNGGGSPAAPGSPGSPSSPSSPSGPTEEYPRDKRNMAGRSSPIPDGRDKGNSKKVSKPESPEEENSKRVDEIGPGGEHGYSDITRSAGGTLSGGSGGGSGEDGPRSFGPGSGRGGPRDGFSPSQGGAGFHGGGASGSGEGGYVTQEVVRKKNSTNEVLSSFSGGSKGGLGGSKLSVSGSEVDSAMKSLAKDFAPNLERNPASQDGTNAGSSTQDGISEAESEDLFTRCHGAHVRCVKAGCVRFE